MKLVDNAIKDYACIKVKGTKVVGYKVNDTPSLQSDIGLAYSIDETATQPTTILTIGFKIDILTPPSPLATACAVYYTSTNN